MLKDIGFDYAMGSSLFISESNTYKWYSPQKSMKNEAIL